MQWHRRSCIPFSLIRQQLTSSCELPRYAILLDPCEIFGEHLWLARKWDNYTSMVSFVHARTLTLPDQYFLEPLMPSGRLSELVDSMVAAHVGCGGRGFDLSSLLCPVSLTNISPWLYNNSRHSWRSYMYSGASLRTRSQINNSRHAPCLYYLFDCIHWSAWTPIDPDIAPRWFAMRTNQYAYESKRMKNLCTKRCDCTNGITRDSRRFQDPMLAVRVL